MAVPLTTERLVVRQVEIGDVEALQERRDHPDTARYQDWPLPHPLEDSRRLVAGAAKMAGPTDGEWWMGTVVERASGAEIGDVAVRLGSAGRAATIGYTLHPDHWGRGFATEAVGVLVDDLIAGGVRRFSATIHPDNQPSMRVVERLGFSYEGRTVGSWFLDGGPAADTTDDLLFGLTAEARSRWVDRPTSRPETVELVLITAANQRKVSAVETHYWQRVLVAPVAASYGDALFPPVVDGIPVQTWMRAIELSEVGPVGFVLLSVADEAGAEPYLWRLLIDRWHQRRGIASMVLDQIEADLAADGHRSLRTTWRSGLGSPEAFYRARGYEPTGQRIGPGVEARKLLG